MFTSFKGRRPALVHSRLAIRPLLRCFHALLPLASDRCRLQLPAYQGSTLSMALFIAFLVSISSKLRPCTLHTLEDD